MSTSALCRTISAIARALCGEGFGFSREERGVGHESVDGEVMLRGGTNAAVAAATVPDEGATRNRRVSASSYHLLDEEKEKAASTPALSTEPASARGTYSAPADLERDGFERTAAAAAYLVNAESTGWQW